MAGLLDTFMGSFGAAAPPLLPAAGLTAWLAVLIAVLYSFNLAPRLAERLFSSALMGALVLATTVAISPKVSQSLFWGQAAACSIPSLILATVYPGLIQKTPQKGYGYWLGFILAFTAGGFSETYVALQTSTFAVLLLAAITASRPGAINKTMAWYLTGFLGSFTALIIVFVSPGNLVRQHLFPPPPGLMELLKITLASWLAFWVRTLTTPTILAGLVSLL